MCGATPAEPEHCETPTNKRKARNLGEEAIKLPPASSARELFREALKMLMGYVNPEDYAELFPEGDGVRDFLEFAPRDFLGALEEYLQGEHIVSSHVYRPDPSELVILRREDFTAEEWEEACEHFHEFPSAKVIWSDPMSVSPRGAKRTPSEMLVKLIGAYVIAGKPLKPLVEKLHPKPETVNWEKIERYIYGHKTPDKYVIRRGRHVDGMLDKLRLIATEVRGGNTRTGPFDELSRKELSTAWEITEMEKDGLTRDEIYEELKDEGYTRDDVNRLSQLRPKQPD